MDEAKVLSDEAKVAPVKDPNEVRALAATAVQEVEPILTHARTLQVVDEPTYQVAMQGAARCRKAKARVEELFGEARDLAHKAHKAITGAIKSLVDPLTQAESIYGNKAYAWQKQERERREAEELARQQAEKAAKAEEKLDVAAFLDSAGAHAEAEQVLEQPVNVVPQEVKVAAPEGVSVRENWQWRCVSLTDLVRAAADGRAPMSVVTTADTVITKMVKALKAETRLPGIEVWDQGTVVVRKEA